MIYAGEHFAVTVSAIAGVLAAGGKRVDLFGVIVLALVTALGGGSVRDIALGSYPIVWVAHPDYVLNAAGTAFVFFFIARYWKVPPAILAVADAFGLALFTILGTVKGLSAGVGDVNAVMLGVITGVTGGIIRDVLVGEVPMVFQKEIYLYATAAFCGAAFFVLLEHWRPGGESNRLAATAVTLLLRLAAIRWKLTLPLYREQRPPPQN